MFESYSYNTATVLIDWIKEGAVTILPESRFTAADFALFNVSHYKHTEV